MDEQIRNLLLYINYLEKNGEGVSEQENTAYYYVTHDKALAPIVSTINNLDTRDSRTQAINKFFEDVNNKINNIDKEKDALNRLYGLNLTKSDVDHMKLQNGVEIVSFFDEKIGRKRIVEYNSIVSLISDFSNIQNNNTNYQTNNLVNNTINIVSNETLTNSSKELQMIDIEVVKSKYKDFIGRIKDESNISNINKLIEQAESKNIKYINLENMIALDKDGKVIEAYFDKNDNVSKLDTPITYKAKVDEVKTEENVNGEENINYENNVEPTEYETKEDVVSAVDLDLENEMKICNISGNPDFIYYNIIKYQDDITKLDEDLRDNSITKEEFDFYDMMVQKYMKKMQDKHELSLEYQKNTINNRGFTNLLFISVILLALAIILFII